MILKIINKFQKPIAAFFAFVFYLQLIAPLHSLATAYSAFEAAPSASNHLGFPANKFAEKRATKLSKFHALTTSFKILSSGTKSKVAPVDSSAKTSIGGPASPEASTFKPAGANNLVNLFTGDFSYSLPLLDVGGYPINIFYNGGISMEQEASWVGLGWNINPGAISRNMRGVPDDFDGTDTLIQTQNVKPNKTWGGEASIDGEALGIKTPKINLSMGYSYNNYLGPEVDFGAGVSVSIPITKTLMHEKSAPGDSSQGLNLGLGLGAKMSSRSGFTLSPSLNAGLHSVSQKMDLGIGLSTSYNGRTGIKDLNIASQTSFNSYGAKKDKNSVEQSFQNHIGPNLINSSITFARPSYTPTLRVPMQYANYSGQVEFGLGMFGLRGAATLQGYYSESKVADGSTVLYKPMVGFLYLENANGHKNAVMDFNRLNDGEVTPNTRIISAPQYDYDVFNIQGEGTGGAIRAYRGDVGFMKDIETKSKDKNISIGVDIAPAGHYGGNWNAISSPTRSGGWDDVNNTLNQSLVFKGARTNSSFENIYFRNPGEASVSNDNGLSKIGYDNLVRFKLSGSAVLPRLTSQLEQFGKRTGTSLTTLPIANSDNLQRDKRTQVITMLNAFDASKIGLDTYLKNYLSSLDVNNNLQATTVARVGGYRKANHISEIDVLEQSGMRYVYGLPVYNTIQKDFTFSVTNTGDANTNMVPFAANETTIGSPSITGNTGVDGYVNIQQTPAYASSFLITGLLSPDYVDVTGNGITEDDLGSAVKFNYTMSPTLSTWRTPRNVTGEASNLAHFNDGTKTEKRDNKATISYGKREAWYMHSIESKSMIALFKTSSRNDSKGVNSELDGTVNSSENANLKLDSILLYTKAELKAKGLAAAIPLKTVHFDYSYQLCNGTPDNTGGLGKLTLKDIYFTYNGQSRASKNLYVFDYGNLNSNYDNPTYARNASDRWGTYKPVKDSSGIAVNPAGLTNIDYPYTSTNKSVDDQFAGGWSLKKILLPSGGQIEVQYEADDYAYVQNRRAGNLFSLYGMGTTTNYTQGNLLYTIYENADQNFVYVQLPAALQTNDPAKAKQEIYAKYLEGINQLAFKLNVNMPKGLEPLTVYSGITDYGLCPNSAGNNIIYIQLTPVDSKGPLANASVQYLINNLPGQAFDGYDMSENTSIVDFFKLIAISLGSITKAFQNAESQVRSLGLGSAVTLASSFIRLNAPTLFKYGGGHRVKRVLMKDNWNAMSGQYTSQYGQDYDYTTTALINNVPTTISSGVASYEPGIGSEENPFREILQFKNQMPAASAIYGAIEMPVLEALFPAQAVGYSKVSVRSINRNGTQGSSIVRSAVGKQVTEFYTAKDYPVFTSYTPMSNMDYHSSTPFSFFYKEVIDKRTTSQGFLVETNDMHGKMKSQAAYSESDSKTPISYTLHTYKNTGQRGLNDKVDFVQNSQSGTIIAGNMGVDMELMTDVREFSAISKGLNGQAQIDFLTFVPFPVFVTPFYLLASYSENNYRAVTTTKLINYHAIDDSVIVNDKGSTISTKTILYDAETGMPVVTQTANEFNDPVYNVSLPAYWAYSGVDAAYKNIGMKFTGVNILNGKIQLSSNIDTTAFESGDELYVTTQGTAPVDACYGPLASGTVNKLWVFDINKNNTALTVPMANRNLMILDIDGNPYTGLQVAFTIVRSGKRNNLTLIAGTASTMRSPIQLVSGVRKLILDNSDNVVAAAAVGYKEKWQADNGIIPKTSVTTVNCIKIESKDCNGNLTSHANPYLAGLVGNYKPYRSFVYYGSRNETDPSINTTIRKNGYINGFSNYWNFDANNNLVPDNNNSKWVWNSELTKVNAHGQELETKDPLNRYTAAQYGFEKNLPVATVQNARYGESFSEGFEDYNFAGQMNTPNAIICDSSRYLNFLGFNNSLVNTDTSTIKAHTGKYVLKVAGSTGINQYIKTLTAIGTINDDYNYIFSKDTTQNLATQGGDTTTTGMSGSYYQPWTASFTGTSAFFMDFYPSATAFHQYGITGSTYIQITSQNTYNFSISLITAYSNLTTTTYSNSIGVSIYDLNNNLINSTTLSKLILPNLSYLNYSIPLCPGIYRITSNIDELYAQGTNPSNSHNSYSWQCSNCSSLDYKSLSKVSGCIFTKPVTPLPAMMNSSFSVIPGKKMQFSAWVQEACGNATGTPCFLTNYTKNHVIIQFPGTTTADIIGAPTGPIIEGWQKIEFAFTVPPDATTANLVLSNDGLQHVYFDDIRLHPFNANMKSYVYDDRSLRLSAELDENNYASFYDYDAEGQLVRVKKETAEGIKTIKETRSAKQKTITTIQ